MHNVSGPVADVVLVDLGELSFQHLLDIGGGSGTWTIAFLRQTPHAVATLFDLPEVVAMARQRLASVGLSNRVTLATGDFYADPLPTGADLALLSAIAHQNSRAQNRVLFSKVHTALTDGGRLLIRDVVMDDAHTHPPAGALFAVNMLVATEGGGTFSLTEFREDLEAAGFRDVKLLRADPWMDSFVMAAKTTGPS
jgi:cyclopropane fatty-acyl-phospholipid synthase-like methyltransferase